MPPGGTVHVVARCNNREFSFTTAEDFDLLIAHLRELVRTYEITLYAYALMSNYVHLLLQAPTHEALGQPLRWFREELVDVASEFSFCLSSPRAAPPGAGASRSGGAVLPTETDASMYSKAEVACFLGVTTSSVNGLAVSEELPERRNCPHAL